MKVYHVGQTLIKHLISLDHKANYQYLMLMLVTFQRAKQASGDKRRHRLYLSKVN